MVVVGDLNFWRGLGKPIRVARLGGRSDATERGARVTGAAVVDWSVVASVTLAPFATEPGRMPRFSSRLKRIASSAAK